MASERGPESQLTSHRASNTKSHAERGAGGRASAACGGIHRTLRFPSRLLISTSPSTHPLLRPLFIKLTRRNLAPSIPSPPSLPLRPQRRPPPPLPSLSSSAPRGHYHSLASKPGWLHSRRRRSGGSSAPSPSSTPAGDLSSSTKVGYFPLSVPPFFPIGA
jgi:hypothetical protein